MKNTTKIAASIALALTLISTVLAGNATFTWTLYPTNGGANIINVYGIPGTNTAFTAGNSNATVIASTSSTNTSLTISNLPAGAWTFTSTAEATNSGLESTNSPLVTGIVPLKGILNFTITGVTP